MSSTVTRKKTISYPFVVFTIIVSVLLSSAAIADSHPVFVDDREIPPEPALAGSFYDAEMTVDGINRSYHYYRPANIQKGAPLVIVLHGSMETGPRIRQMFAYGFDLAADEHGFVVVYPDGFDHHWNDCSKIAPFQANIRNINDLGFIDTLIEEFVSEQQIDPDKIFATGFSNGGHMSLRLFMERPRSFRAVAAMNANLQAAENFKCSWPDPESVPSALLASGTADPVLPHTGGEVEFMGESRGRHLSSEATVALLRSAAGLENAPLVESVLPDHNKDDCVHATEKIWRDGGTRQVRLLTQHGAGHTLAHPVYRTMPSIGGKFSQDFSAAEYIWSFFSTTLE